ncbi:Uncharacterised protein [Nocardia brasiliensis]|nr:Uncharacterised protein [Nocardia brasiliensis]
MDRHVPVGLEPPVGSNPMRAKWFQLISAAATRLG